MPKEGKSDEAEQEQDGAKPEKRLVALADLPTLLHIERDFPAD